MQTEESAPATPSEIKLIPNTAVVYEGQEVLYIGRFERHAVISIPTHSCNGVESQGRASVVRLTELKSLDGL